MCSCLTLTQDNHSGKARNGNDAANESICSLTSKRLLPSVTRWLGCRSLLSREFKDFPFFEKCGKRTPGPGPRFNSVGEKKWLWVSHELCPRKGMNHKPVQGSYPANVQIAQVCCMRKRRMQGCLKSRDKFKASDFCDGVFPYFLAFFRAVVPQGHGR